MEIKGSPTSNTGTISKPKKPQDQNPNNDKKSSTDPKDIQGTKDIHKTTNKINNNKS